MTSLNQTCSHSGRDSPLALSLHTLVIIIRPLSLTLHPLVFFHLFYPLFFFFFPHHLPFLSSTFPVLFSPGFPPSSFLLLSNAPMSLDTLLPTIPSSFFSSIYSSFITSSIVLFLSRFLSLASFVPYSVFFLIFFSPSTLFSPSHFSHCH